MSDTELLLDNKRAHTTKTVRHDARVRECIKWVHEGQVVSLLDIGCGDGGFLRAFPDIPHRVGMDVVPRDLGKDIRFVLHDVTEKLPFTDASYDAVFVGEVLEHLLDTERFFRECNRILRPGGALVLTTPNLCALKNLYFWARGRQLQYVDHKLGQLGHVRYFSPQSIREILSDNGFRVVKLATNGYNLSDYSRSLQWIEDLSIPNPQTSTGHTSGGGISGVFCWPWAPGVVLMRGRSPF